MTTFDITPNIIGKKVSVWWTGMRITGTITELYEDQYSIGFYMRFDEPGYWGGEVYKSDLFIARKSDGWCSENWILLS